MEKESPMYLDKDGQWKVKDKEGLLLTDEEILLTVEAIPMVANSYGG